MRRTVVLCLATVAAARLCTASQPDQPWLAVEVVDSDCRPLDGGMTVVLWKRSGKPSGKPVQKRNAGDDGVVSFEPEPEGVFDVLAGSPGYMDTRVGPVPLNEESHLSLRVMLSPDPSREAATLRQTVRDELHRYRHPEKH